jgi:hypothetical protein
VALVVTIIVYLMLYNGKLLSNLRFTVIDEAPSL